MMLSQNIVPTFRDFCDPETSFMRDLNFFESCWTGYVYSLSNQIKMSLKTGNVFLYYTVSFMNTLLTDITEI